MSPGRVTIGDRVAVREAWAGAVVEATLARITFANAQTGYTVARVNPRRGGELVTVVGSLLGARPGETLRLQGRWGAHPQHCRQFQVEDYTTVLPATVQGMRRHLGPGFLRVPQVMSA